MTKNRKEKSLRETNDTFESLVTEALPNGMFRVCLENDTIILGYISGKIKSLRETKDTFEGLVMEALPNRMFHIRLENDTINLGYILGKIRSSSIWILIGDRVKIEVSRYDSNMGHIIYRLPHKDSKCTEDSKDTEDLKDTKDSKD